MRAEGALPLVRTELRQLQPGEVDEVLDVDEEGFSSRMKPAHREIFRQHAEMDRTVLSRGPGGETAGVAVSVAAKMTLPGLHESDVAAVVGIAVRPTHRRQGRLRAMMRVQLDDVRERGEAIAVLTASESRIYQRFGYGPATLASAYILRSRDLSVVGGSEARDGEEAGAARRPSLSYVESERAWAEFPAVLAAAQARRAGEVSRLSLGWFQTFGWGDESADEKPFFVLCHEDGQPTGYVVYSVALVTEDGVRTRRLTLRELVAATDAAYLALWTFVIDVDLVDEIRTAQRPVDEPIRWLLSDYRRMQPGWTNEHTFVRLVSAEPALAARGYFDEGSLVLALRDPVCEWNAGRYRITVGGDGVPAVEFEPEGGASGSGGGGSGSGGNGDRGGDLELDAAALGSIYLGGLRPSALGQVGLIAEQSPGALQVADRMFVGAEPPYCTTNF